MADNIPVTPGTGSSVATDEVGGVHYQIVKQAFGALDSATLVSGANPLPVAGAVTVSGTVSVSGSFYQTTQPVSIASMPSTPVTGTFWQATQPVSGTVAVTGTFYQATQPVSAASLPLPTGAATETTLAALSTKTPALGQATMASSQPVTLASNQSALAVTGTFWQATQPVSGTVAATQSGTWNIGAITTLPALPANQSVNNAQLGGVAVAVGSGVTGTGVQRVTLATDVALPAGSNVIGALTANQSVNNAQIAGVATSTGNGVVGTGVQRVAIASDNTAFAVTNTPAAATNTIGVLSAATTNARSEKASAGTLHGLSISNVGAATAFVKLYNKASAPTVGTDIPVLTIPVAASGVVSVNFGTIGHRFTQGIALAITNLVAHTDTTAVASQQVQIIGDYI